ncbi:hypothetical protein Q0Z83_025040 [Actinoplanes sichuanensis]|uniref:Uncharacterized protein n=1 Tax=Actinoplanes sichuanensis TaxID=512349 RepID=A0ABW4A026_9ACTN|nr:hypothetical protein [Actinoplanes sichuanensis]BEL04313.1 hypothetical protein Q0Z83_025040 [Actinoplanes sichuanensis]
MDDLPAMLREATRNPPPTRIDLDRMIDGERRRKTWRTASAGSVLAVITAIGGVAWTTHQADRATPAVTASRPPVTPSTPAPSPCTHPTDGVGAAARTPQPVRPLPETHDTAIARLTAALPHLIPPGSRPSRTSSCDRVEFWWNKQAAAYQAVAWQGDGATEVSMVILVRAAERSDTTPHCLAATGSACTRTDLGPGEIAMSDSMPLIEGERQRSVTVYRPDSTRVSVVVIGRPASLPTVAGLTEIARSADLTLYP